MEFEFIISYVLKNNTLEVNHTVRNLDIKPIYFSLGGHPAFNCPLYSNENYEFTFYEHNIVGVFFGHFWVLFFLHFVVLDCIF